MTRTSQVYGIIRSFEKSTGIDLLMAITPDGIEGGVKLASPVRISYLEMENNNKYQVEEILKIRAMLALRSIMDLCESSLKSLSER